MEPFTLVEENRSLTDNKVFFKDVVSLTSAPTADHDLQYIVALRKANPGLVVTGIPTYNVPLLAFAAAGFATYELDTETDSFASWRGYAPPTLRQNRGGLAETVHFAKYHYKWGNEDFILYTVGNVQYVLKETAKTESETGPSAATDALIMAVGDWLLSDEHIVWVFDNGYWRRDKKLWQEVEKASWEKVILNEDMKKELTSVANNFFSGKDVYADLGVPWKRGLMFHGPPGNGKTISIKALMNTVLSRKDPIPTLYVKAAPYTYHIEQVFAHARSLSPCMLILEDIETIVTAGTRSYFFNELDGLANNDGLFIVASTNYLDRLDPGLTSRPSRFDRKYLFPIPNEYERYLYCEYWRNKLSENPKVRFPKKISPAMAYITSDFSFAFLQECFVASLLVLARDEVDAVEHKYPIPGEDDEELEKYELWVVFKEQAEALRKDMHDGAANDQVDLYGFGLPDPFGMPPPPKSGSKNSLFLSDLDKMARRDRRQKRRGAREDRINSAWAHESEGLEDLTDRVPAENPFSQNQDCEKKEGDGKGLPILSRGKIPRMNTAATNYVLP